MTLMTDFLSGYVMMMVATTSLVRRLITETVLEPEFETYTKLDDGRTASPHGLFPTGMGIAGDLDDTSVFVEVLITETVFEPAFAT